MTKAQEKAAQEADEKAEAERLANEQEPEASVATETLPEPEPEVTEPVVETPPAPAGLFIPDAVKELLAKPRIHIDKAKEAGKIRTPFVPINPAEFARCLKEGIPFTGQALWESVYLQPLTDGGLLVNIGTSLQSLGTLELVSAETNEGMAVRGGQGGGVNAPAMQLVFGNPEALRILKKAGVPMEGETGLDAQFRNTSVIQALRNEHRNWRASIAEERRAAGGGRGGRPPYVRTPSGPVQAQAQPADKVAPADFQFEA